MRISTAALNRVVRRALGTTVATAVIGGTAVLTAGAAGAAAVVTADTCAGVVAGRTADTVSIDGEALAGLVKQGAKEAQTIVVIHHLTIWPNHLARKISDEPVEIGTVPEKRTSTIDGDTIATAVTDALDGSAGLGALPSTQRTTLDQIAATVSAACEITVENARSTEPGTNSPAPGSAEGTGTSEDRDGRGDRDSNSADSGSDSDSDSGAAGDGGDGEVAAGGLQGSGDARVARDDYSGIPAADAPGAGIAVPEDLRYAPANGVPGDILTPRYGTLDGETGETGEHGNSTGSGDVRDAGDAETLAAHEQSQTVRLPMLLAVVALAAVTAGLVRTWALRRAS
ncbi:hypothetical protein FFT09_07920 [Saccharomonospora piscinae]|uniref:hypothetical protein n=1 Tax=Saccharomonospora piscinae TaxID=687388 RepID=UPI001106F7EE|nr:hypothetical protein [Saccharomonospora piscinae]TLW93328.1 hypothetical protein FFT09_07920 [Saccharomonospora piscinae]